MVYTGIGALSRDFASKESYDTKNCLNEVEHMENRKKTLIIGGVAGGASCAASCAAWTESGR